MEYIKQVGEHARALTDRYGADRDELVKYIDLHVHTRRGGSCSSITPSSLLAHVQEHEIPCGGFVLTEHMKGSHLWTQGQWRGFGEEMEHLGYKAFLGAELYFSIELVPDRPSSFEVLVYPPEITDDLLFHIYDLARICREKGRGFKNPIQLAMNAMRAQGCALVLAHPFRNPKSSSTLAEEIEGLPLCAIETYNGSLSDQQNASAGAFSEMVCKEIPGKTEGSDAHLLEHIGRNVTNFNEPPTTQRELAEQLCSLADWTPSTGSRIACLPETRWW